MKINKNITKLIDLILDDSFKTSGEVNESMVRKHVKTLKNLPIPHSIIGLSEYLRRLKLELSYTTVEIESATPLTSTQVSHITKAIRAEHLVTGVRTIINPNILGGLKIKVGDNVYDDSVSRRILQLGEEIRGE